IMNLVLNARDAMPRGGKLTLETGNVELDGTFTRTNPDVLPGPYVRLTVVDTGCGMDAETQARVFEPFFTTKEQGRGTGLGLATVYGIIKQSGGHVSVQSQLDVGTRFTIYLPRIREEAATLRADSRIAEPCRGTEVLLLVEDDDGVRRLTCGLLRKQGYTVLE